MVILIDQYNLPEDIYQVIFATEQQEIVAKMLIKYMWENKGEIGKTEMSVFATQLHEGNMILKEQGKSPLQKQADDSSWPDVAAGDGKREKVKSGYNGRYTHFLFSSQSLGSAANPFLNPSSSASLRNNSALSVLSQVKSGSFLPKCPYAAVFP